MILCIRTCVGAASNDSDGLAKSASSSRIQNRGPSSEERKGEGGGATTTTTTIGDTGDCFFVAFCCVALAEIDGH